jgi:hypothetical protein
VARHLLRVPSTVDDMVAASFEHSLLIRFLTNRPAYQREFKTPMTAARAIRLLCDVNMLDKQTNKEKLKKMEKQTKEESAVGRRAVEFISKKKKLKISELKKTLCLHS